MTSSLFVLVFTHKSFHISSLLLLKFLSLTIEYIILLLCKLWEDVIFIWGVSILKHFADGLDFLPSLLDFIYSEPKMPEFKSLGKP